MREVKRISYLATPYSHPEPDVRENRFKAVTRAAGDLMKRGYIVFSPITHGHPIARVTDLPLDWEYWQDYCRAYLANCERIIVLQLYGWQDSVGVKAELAIARELGIEVKYMDPETLSLWDEP